MSTVFLCFHSTEGVVVSVKNMSSSRVHLHYMLSTPLAEDPHPSKPISSKQHPVSIKLIECDSVLQACVQRHSSFFCSKLCDLPKSMLSKGGSFW